MADVAAEKLLQCCHTKENLIAICCTADVAAEMLAALCLHFLRKQEMRFGFVTAAKLLAHLKQMKPAKATAGAIVKDTEKKEDCLCLAIQLCSVCIHTLRQNQAICWQVLWAARHVWKSTGAHNFASGTTNMQMTVLHLMVKLVLMPVNQHIEWSTALKSDIPCTPPNSY